MAKSCNSFLPTFPWTRGLTGPFLRRENKISGVSIGQGWDWKYSRYHHLFSRLTLLVAGADVHVLQVLLVISEPHSNIFLKKNVKPDILNFTVLSDHLLIFYYPSQTNSDFLLVLRQVDHHHVGGVVRGAVWGGEALLEARNVSTTITGGDREPIKCYLPGLDNSILVI